MSGSPLNNTNAGGELAGLRQCADPPPDPHHDEWTISSLSLALALDRRTVTKRLQGVPPARTHGKTRFYRLADAVRACFDHPTLVAEAALRHRLLQAAAEKAETELRARKEELVDRSEVRRLLTTRGKAERDAHLLWVARAAAIAASETGADAGRLAACLDRELRDHLAYLAATPLEELLSHG